MKIKDVIIEKLNSQMIYDYKFICLNCLHRDSHPVVYCRFCGTSFIRYDKKVHKINSNEWIKRATTFEEKERRISHLAYTIRGGYLSVNNKRFSVKLVTRLINENLK